MGVRISPENRTTIDVGIDTWHAPVVSKDGMVLVESGTFSGSTEVDINTGERITDHEFGNRLPAIDENGSVASLDGTATTALLP
ncbi:hypothetical protein [Haloferax gibbonsii]|uniref:hypothetical protein n=1 Tax=Haloferax gibbonsii TaxID=35746 RepID=UPI001267E157|nr:hypothetical protein [Haloferax gibbonsii]